MQTARKVGPGLLLFYFCMGCFANGVSLLEQTAELQPQNVPRAINKFWVKLVVTETPEPIPEKYRF